MPLDYYLALFQLHIAVVGVVIAGIVALVQLLNTSKPQRDISLLISRSTLLAYGALLVVLLCTLAIGSWVSAFPGQASLILGTSGLDFFSSAQTGLMIVLLMLFSLGWFVTLALKTRILLDTHLYLKTYVEKTPAKAVHAYLKAIYAQDTLGSAPPTDPFQPIREYIKDNAFKYYDYGTADGLRHFSRLFDKALANSRQRRNDQAEYERLARYMSESCEELFRIFVKTASEKRQSDTVNLLYSKGMALLNGEHDVAHASLMPIVHGLENIAKLSDDDDEVIDAINSIRKLCDEFLESHKQHKWEHIAGLFDEICLSLSRISEDYYLQKNKSLKTVPIVSYSTGEHRTVTSALVEFFAAYRDLGDRYTDATPLSYFDAIEGVIEVLFVRLGDIVSNGQQDVGFNRTYHELARNLYDIYFGAGIDAIEHDNPELLALASSNLRQIMKPAKNFKLNDERQTISNMLVELAARSIDARGDTPLKGDDQPISDYVVAALREHATNAHGAQAIAALKQTDANLSKPAVKRFLADVAAA